MLFVIVRSYFGESEISFDEMFKSFDQFCSSFNHARKEIDAEKTRQAEMKQRQERTARLRAVTPAAHTHTGKAQENQQPKHKEGGSTSMSMDVELLSPVRKPAHAHAHAQPAAAPETQPQPQPQAAAKSPLKQPAGKKSPLRSPLRPRNVDTHIAVPDALSPFGAKSSKSDTRGPKWNRKDAKSRLTRCGAENVAPDDLAALASMGFPLAKKQSPSPKRHHAHTHAHSHSHAHSHAHMDSHSDVLASFDPLLAPSASPVRGLRV